MYSAYQIRTLEPLPEPEPEPEWVHARYVWATVSAEDDRAIFERSDSSRGILWLSPHYTPLSRDEMATRNPVPVKGEDE